ncbi:hypothetical protein AGLY_003894 [Aphis glycines]|uniref:Uncharacterized protein n=1 Tax=Aphis glycines TaxID=307491 RepID=A0A6G0TWI0_APHGL|nr:hypothetical protein AGLY_003894 [Aphis glycines]
MMLIVNLINIRYFSTKIEILLRSSQCTMYNRASFMLALILDICIGTNFVHWLFYDILFFLENVLNLKFNNTFIHFNIKTNSIRLVFLNKYFPSCTWSGFGNFINVSILKEVICIVLKFLLLALRRQHIWVWCPLRTKILVKYKLWVSMYVNQDTQILILADSLVNSKQTHTLGQNR